MNIIKIYSLVNSAQAQLEMNREAREFFKKSDRKSIDDRCVADGYFKALADIREGKLSIDDIMKDGTK